MRASCSPARSVWPTAWEVSWAARATEPMFWAISLLPRAASATPRPISLAVAVVLEMSLIWSMTPPIWPADSGGAGEALVVGVPRQREYRKGASSAGRFAAWGWA